MQPKPETIIKLLKQAVIYFVLIAGVAVILYPFFMATILSLETPSEIYHIPFVWFPKSLEFSNYPAVFTYINFAQGLLNSTFITVVSLIGSTLISAMAAYALAKFRFAGRRLLFNIVLISLMIPSFLTLIPLYYLVYKLGLINTYLALILPYLGSSYSIFMLRQYILTIPDYLIDAARLDGASELRIFYKIILPMSIPAIAVVAFWNFTTFWNDFLWPLLVLETPNLFTVQLDLSFLQGFEATGTNVAGALMAASMMTIIPAFLVYLIGQSRMKKMGLGGFRG